MVYRMKLDSVEGRTLLLPRLQEGRDDSCVTRALAADDHALRHGLRRATDDTAPVLGKGILHIEPLDFAQQMTTMEVINAPDLKTQLEGMARFGTFFAGVLFEAYGGVFVPRQRTSIRTRRRARSGRCASAPPEVHAFTHQRRRRAAPDPLPGRHPRAGPARPRRSACRAGSSRPTCSRPNLLEYLFAHELRRLAARLPGQHRRSPACAAAVDRRPDRARIDHPEAVGPVPQVTGAETIQVVVHCYGSTTFFMSMLAGLRGRALGRSARRSPTEPRSPAPRAKIKSGLHLPELLERSGVDSLTAYTADATPDWKSHALRRRSCNLVPGPRSEDCRNPVCHRITLHVLAALRARAARRAHPRRRCTSCSAWPTSRRFEHLAADGARQARSVDADGSDVYLPHLDRLAMPIRFIHGAENRCYLPESTERTYDLLCAKQRRRRSTTATSSRATATSTASSARTRPGTSTR